MSESESTDRRASETQTMSLFSQKHTFGEIRFVRGKQGDRDWVSASARIHGLKNTYSVLIVDRQSVSDARWHDLGTALRAEFILC